jgi:hypothetical protein
MLLVEIVLRIELQGLKQFLCLLYTGCIKWMLNNDVKLIRALVPFLKLLKEFWWILLLGMYIKSSSRGSYHNTSRPHNSEELFSSLHRRENLKSYIKNCWKFNFFHGLTNITYIGVKLKLICKVYNELTPWARVVFRKSVVTLMFKNFFVSVEPESSFPCSQQPATDIYPEPVKVYDFYYKYFSI